MRTAKSKHRVYQMPSEQTQERKRGEDPEDKRPRPNNRLNMAFSGLPCSHQEREAKEGRAPERSMKGHGVIQKMNFLAGVYNALGFGESPSNQQSEISDPVPPSDLVREHDRNFRLYEERAQELEKMKELQGLAKDDLTKKEDEAWHMKIYAEANNGPMFENFAECAQEMAEMAEEKVEAARKATHEKRRETEEARDNFLG